MPHRIRQRKTMQKQKANHSTNCLVEFLKPFSPHKEKNRITLQEKPALIVLIINQKKFSVSWSACVFCHNQPAICSFCRIKKAVTLNEPKKKMNKAGRAII
jgi:hypothetical protein